jgi:hypothetical protein
VIIVLYKIHISNNFILSISLLIVFDTLLLRLSLHCNTPLHFTTLHPTTLHNTYRRFTSSHLPFTTLSFSFTHLHFLSFYTSHHITSNHFTSHHITLHYIISLHITSHHITSLYITSYHFTSHPITRHNTDLILKIISKKVNPFTALKKLTILLYFTSLFILFIYLLVLSTLHFTLLSYS